MSMRKILNRVSMKTLGRICTLVIVIPAFATTEFWMWQNARKVFDGRSEATYWFAPDGTFTSAFHVAQKNWSAVPIRTVHQYDGVEYAPDALAWYDEYGNKLEWKAVKVGSSRWRYEAQLHTPIDSHEWIRYTVWLRDFAPRTVQKEGQNWGIYQEDTGDWVFRNNTALGPENTVSMIFPANTEIISAEPKNRVTVVSGGNCPTVRFDDLREPHIVKWRAPKAKGQTKPPSAPEALESQAQTTSRKAGQASPASTP